MFNPIVPEERLNRLFRIVAGSRQHAPARQELQATFDRLPKPDGNFIKDFQTTGFSARVWELYLAAYASSIRAEIAQPHERPDFLFSKGSEQVWIEASTANPTEGLVPQTSQEKRTEWEEEDALAIKLGSVLWTKLNKRYWELGHVAGMPLVLAVADFHTDDPMRATPSALTRYLYGTHSKLVSYAKDRVERKTYLLKEVRCGNKTIPADFFAQPDTEHISAVLFSNAGTVAKFNRMAFDRQRYPGIRMLREGFSFDPDPAAIVPEPFAYIVGDAPESWGQEVVVFHNPKALHPISRNFFGEVIQYCLVEGELYYAGVDFHPFMSLTRPAAGDPATMLAIEETLRERGREWVVKVHANRDAMEALVAAEHEAWQPQEI